MRPANTKRTYQIGQRIHIEGIGFGTVYDESEKHLTIMTEYGHIVRVVKGLLATSPTERIEMNEPKFKIDDRVFLRNYRGNVASTITTVAKSCDGSFFYLLDDTYDDHGINDWERQEDLVHENEYRAFLDQSEYLARQEKLREKMVEAEKIRAALNKLEQEINELETK